MSCWENHLSLDRSVFFKNAHTAVCSTRELRHFHMKEKARDSILSYSLFAKARGCKRSMADVTYTRGQFFSVETGRSLKLFKNILKVFWGSSFTGVKPIPYSIEKVSFKVSPVERGGINIKAQTRVGYTLQMLLLLILLLRCCYFLLLQ